MRINIRPFLEWFESEYGENSSFALYIKIREGATHWGYKTRVGRLREGEDIHSGPKTIPPEVLGMIHEN